MKVDYRELEKAVTVFAKAFALVWESVQKTAHAIKDLVKRIGKAKEKKVRVCHSIEWDMRRASQVLVKKPLFPVRKII